MIKIAVCDDETFMREELCREIRDIFREEDREIGLWEFADGGSLLACGSSFDVIFLDIRMEGPDGMETARRLRAEGYGGFLVFITVLTEPVFSSFEVRAFDYLVKPAEAGRLRSTLLRLLSAMDDRAGRSLLIQKGPVSLMVPFEDIVFGEVINRKIFLHLRDGRVADYYDRIVSLENKLDGRFFKCHRSYLINLAYLESFGRGSARLSTGETVPVSRLREEAFSGAVLRYMKERSV